MSRITDWNAYLGSLGAPAPSPPKSPSRITDWNTYREGLASQGPLPRPLYTLTVSLYPSGLPRSIASNVKFQTAPLDDFSYNTQFEHTDFMTISAGEFSRPYGRKLRTLSMETLIVEPGADGYFPSWVKANSEGDRLLGRLQDICSNGKTFILAAGEVRGPGMIDASNDRTRMFMPATLRELKVSEKAGEPNTTYLSLTFSEYRSPSEAADAKALRRTSESRFDSGGAQLVLRWNKAWPGWSRIESDPVFQIPRADDLTLQDLAKVYYGDPSKWRLIDGKNNLGWKGSTPLRKHPKIGDGQVHKLLIPAP